MNAGAPDLTDQPASGSPGPDFAVDVLPTGNRRLAALERLRDAPTELRVAPTDATRMGVLAHAGDRAWRLRFIRALHVASEAADVLRDSLARVREFGDAGLVREVASRLVLAAPSASPEPPPLVPPPSEDPHLTRPTSLVTSQLES